MDASAILALVLTCAPQVAPTTAHALITIESALNPWAIGVVDGHLDRQPRTRAEALATATALQASGWNFSVGLAQINLANFGRLGLTLDTAFEPCTNLQAMQAVLTECADRLSRGAARPPASPLALTSSLDQASLRKTLSCYYSGNFVTGFEHGYVRKVVAATGSSAPARAAHSHPIAQPKEQP